MAAKKRKKRAAKQAKFDVLRLRLDTSGSKLRGAALRAAALSLLEAALKTPGPTARLATPSGDETTPCDTDPDCKYLFDDGPFTRVYLCGNHVVRYDVG